MPVRAASFLPPAVCSCPGACLPRSLRALSSCWSQRAVCVCVCVCCCERCYNSRFSLAALWCSLVVLCWSANRGVLRSLVCFSAFLYMYLGTLPRIDKTSITFHRINCVSPHCARVTFRIKQPGRLLHLHSTSTFGTPRLTPRDSVKPCSLLRS